MKKIAKAILGFLSLLTAGCDNCKHCSCSHHDSHQEAVAWKKDGVYRIALPSEFDKTKTDDCIVLKPAEQQGFAHLCYGTQVSYVIKKYYGAQPDLVILELDPQILVAQGAEIRREATRAGGNVYPHAYKLQKIPVAAVKEVKMLKKDAHGEWEEKK